MTKFQIVLSQQAAKIVKKLKNPDRFRIISSLEIIAQDPFIGKKLVGPLLGKFSFRIGKYRIIYQVDNDILVVFIIDIGQRKNIYE